MKKIRIISLLFLLVTISLLTSCGKEENVEPALYVPKQLKRLLLGEFTKTWRQTTEYYLVDSCHTGSLLRFEDNAPRKVDSAFFAYFIPDTAVCNAGIGAQIKYKVKIKTSPKYQTSDSLLFISPQNDTVIKTVSLLTSQKLMLKVAGEDGKVVATEVYQAVQ